MIQDTWPLNVKVKEPPVFLHPTRISRLPGRGDTRQQKGPSLLRCCGAHLPQSPRPSRRAFLSNLLNSFIRLNGYFVYADPYPSEMIRAFSKVPSGS